MLEVEFTIPESHPSLPGHFPGEPIVPGVVLLSEYFSRLQQSLGKSVSKIKRIKFVNIVKPEQLVSVESILSDAKCKFTAKCNQQIIMQGELEINE